MDMGFGSQVSPAPIPVGSNLQMFAPASKTVDMIDAYNTVLAEGHRTLGCPQQRPTRPRKIRLVLLSSCLPTRSPKPPQNLSRGTGSSRCLACKVRSNHMAQISGSQWARPPLRSKTTRTGRSLCRLPLDLLTCSGVVFRMGTCQSSLAAAGLSGKWSTSASAVSSSWKHSSHHQA